MIKIWISPTESSATVDCALLNKEKLEKAGYKQGYFLTDSELEQIKRGSVKDFIKWAVDVGYIYSNLSNLSLEDYEKMYFKQASKKEIENG